MAKETKKAPEPEEPRRAHRAADLPQELDDFCTEQRRLKGGLQFAPWLVMTLQRIKDLVESGELTL